MKKIKKQYRIKGGRVPIGTGVKDKLKNTIENLARENNCTKSFIITYFLLKGLGIKVNEDEDL